MVKLDYDARRGASVPTGAITVSLDLAELGRQGATQATLHEPGREPRPAHLRVEGTTATVEVGAIAAWTLLEVR